MLEDQAENLNALRVEQKDDLINSFLSVVRRLKEDIFHYQSQIEEARSSVEHKTNRIEELEKQTIQLENRLAEQQQQIESTQISIHEKELENSSLFQQLRNATDKIQMLQQTVVNLENQNFSLKIQYEDKIVQINKQNQFSLAEYNQKIQHLHSQIQQQQQFHELTVQTLQQTLSECNQTSVYFKPPFTNFSTSQPESKLPPQSNKPENNLTIVNQQYQSRSQVCDIFFFNKKSFF